MWKKADVIAKIWDVRSADNYANKDAVVPRAFRPPCLAPLSHIHALPVSPPGDVIGRRAFNGQGTRKSHPPHACARARTGALRISRRIKFALLYR